MSRIKAREGAAGKLFSPGTVLLRRLVGQMPEKTLDTPEYEICLTIPQTVPVIKCMKTGRLWSINWAELVELAEAAGIADEAWSEEVMPFAAEEAR